MKVNVLSAKGIPASEMQVHMYMYRKRLAWSFLKLMFML